MDGPTDEWMNGGMDRDERTDGPGRTDGWTNGQTDGLTDERTGGWMHEQHISPFFFFFYLVTTFPTHGM